MMPDFEFSLTEGSLTPDELVAALDQLPSALDSRLEQAAQDIGEKVRGDAAANAPVDTGQLASSIEAVVDAVAGTLIQIRVGSNLDYAPAQEYGTDAGHFPPVSALRDWARRVLGDADLAYPVARSISETGIEEQRYLRDAFEDNLMFAVETIDDAVRGALSDVGLR